MWLSLQASDPGAMQGKKQNSAFQRSRCSLDQLLSSTGARARVALGRKPLRRAQPPRLTATGSSAMVMAVSPSAPSPTGEDGNDQAFLPPIRTSGHTGKALQRGGGSPTRRRPSPAFGMATQPTALLPQLLPTLHFPLTSHQDSNENEGKLRKADATFSKSPRVARRSPSPPEPHPILVQSSPPDYSSPHGTLAALRPNHEEHAYLLNQDEARRRSSSAHGSSTTSHVRPSSFREPLTFSISHPIKLETRESSATSFST